MQTDETAGSSATDLKSCKNMTLTRPTPRHSLFLTVLIASITGCGQINVRIPNPPIWRAAPALPVLTREVKPTLVEPSLASPKDTSQWFNDRVSSGAEVCINYGCEIDLEALKKLQSEPAILNVLNISLMPDPRDIGLIGRLAALRAGNDAKLVPLMQAVEADGRALAQVAEANPDEVTWLVEEVQGNKRELNKAAAQAVAGDADARQRLYQFSARIDSFKVAPLLKRALNTIISARWQARIRYGTDDTAYSTFRLLRSRSFASAIDQMKNQNTVDHAWTLGGATTDPNAQPGCFAMEKTGWSLGESSRYRSACVRGAIEQPWYDEACQSDRAVSQMNALLREASLRLNVIAELKRQRDRLDDPSMRLALPLRVHSVANRYDIDKKIALCLAELKTAATVEKYGERFQITSTIGASYLALTPYKAAQFRSLIAPDGRRVLRLEWVFGSMVPDPTLGDSINQPVSPK